MPLTYDSKPTTDSEAVERALNLILNFALQDENFVNFGSDIFQTFYDVATTAEEPLRKFALLRTEVMAQMWLQYYPSFKDSGDENEEASPDSVMDFIMGIYTLERVGIGHDSKEQVREAAKKLSIEDIFDIPEGALSPKIRHLRPTMQCSQYATCLTYTFYASKVGIDIHVDLATVLRFLPLYRPYKAFSRVKKGEESFDEYADQLTMIFNLIHVLSNYGELRLAPSLMPQEYAYLSDPVHIDRAVQFGDVHLAGEICHCLRVFGMAENSPLLIKGLSFLRLTQKLDGSWPTRDGNCNCLCLIFFIFYFFRQRCGILYLSCYYVRHICSKPATVSRIWSG
jgi:hypothetical protein